MHGGLKGKDFSMSLIINQFITTSRTHPRAMEAPNQIYNQYRVSSTDV